jgi:dihydrofolate synthase / folylpolyglutamate synthase
VKRIMAIRTLHEAEDLVYQSYMRAKDHIPADNDAKTRDISLTKRLLALAGNPDQGSRTILVTGSKGKGSTSRLIATLLKEAGFKVGLFTSPHLVDFTERIQVDGESIPSEDFIMIMNDIEDAVHTIDKTLTPEKYLGPIGITLTAALIYFKMKKTDINVIECGRGGRYDDTNVLANEWAVITPIMEEHLGQLGDTVYTIADHKLGIVKESTKNVIIGRQNVNVMSYMKSQLDEAGKNSYFFGEDMAASVTGMNGTALQFNVKTTQSEYHNLRLPLLGTFQADNAAVAVQVCETLLDRPLDLQLVEQAFQGAKWPGRCEILAENPTIILDGAINRKSAAYLGEMVQALNATSVVSIIAVPEDKDYQGVIEACHYFSKHLIITEPVHSHKQFPKDAVEVAKGYNPDARLIKPFQKALLSARQLHPDLILILGTQTFIGEVKSIWNKITRT